MLELKNMYLLQITDLVRDSPFRDLGIVLSQCAHVGEIQKEGVVKIHKKGVGKIQKEGAGEIQKEG